jgi:hypothetical protein
MVTMITEFSLAIAVFNDLFQEGRKVAAGFHITC